MPLDRVLEAARLEGQAEGGVREIPLDLVVGSAQTGKTRDFDATFLPLSPRLRERWTQVHEAVQAGAELEPIAVYELGGRYYVIDGHHRVSVLRSLGVDRIPAQVTEVRTRVPLQPDLDPAALLRAAEYAAFLQTTELDRVRPVARLEVSRLGRYDELLKHILGHRYFLGLEQKREVPLPEAAASWYDTVYLPVIEVIRRHGIVEQLPGLTETDLYIEVTRRWLAMGEAGEEPGPHQAAHALIDDWSHTRRTWLGMVLARVTSAARP